MAIYTGFFDAAFDEDTGTYDREYGSADFTEYFGQIVGSGVCVYGNDDSMKVYYDSASQRAVVNPGYLFIRGYWLRNDGLYTVNLADLPAGVYAIRAVLNMGSRAITIGQVAKADPEEYPDALVLAYATVEAGSGVSVEDTRSRTDICGLIDAAGSLSQKVEYAIHYIDNEIQEKLDQIQQDLQAQEAEIDGKIEEANSLIAQIAPPAIGTIKFSASQDIEEGWLRCDGSFINEADYPELVAALGKNYPSGDKFQLLNTTGVGRQISNGVVCLGRLWVFSYEDRKLYGIDLEGDEAPKVIDLTSEDPNFSGWQNPNSNFLALSIIPNLTTGIGYHLFLAQINSIATAWSFEWDSTKDLIYTAECDLSEENITMSTAFSTIDIESSYDLPKSALPYVISRMEGGKEKFYCMLMHTRGITGVGSSYGYIAAYWDASSTAELKYGSLGRVDNYHEDPVSYNFIMGFKSNSYGDAVLIHDQVENATSDKEKHTVSITSIPNGTFTIPEVTAAVGAYISYESATTSAIASANKVLLQISPDLTKAVVIRSDPSVGISEITVGVFTPGAAKSFVDAGAYLWGKDIFMVFVGTGIIFSRSLTEGSFGYLDTTSVLGTITQYASIRYSQDEGTLYIAGQDTTNTVRAAKIVLNTLYDYANDGAWLPMIASDGIPAYIKAKEVGGA